MLARARGWLLILHALWWKRKGDRAEPDSLEEHLAVWKVAEFLEQLVAGLAPDAPSAHFLRDPFMTPEERQQHLEALEQWLAQDDEAA